MRYSPSELVSSARVRLVSVLNTETWAPGTPAPVASVTWPYIVDEVICALNRPEERIASKQKRNTTLDFPRIGFSYQSAGHLCARLLLVVSACSTGAPPRWSACAAL